MAIWNLEDIYPWEKTDELIAEFKSKVEEFKKAKELLPDISTDDFMKYFLLSEQIAILAHKLTAYIGLKTSENTSDTKALSHEAMIDELETNLGNETIFFWHWFKELDDKQTQEYIDASGEYKYYLECVRKYKPYMLTENEERIISLKGLSGSSEIVKLYSIMTNKWKYPWKGKELTREELAPMVRSVNRDDRKGAYDIMLGKYGEEEVMLGEMYKAVVNDWKTDIQIRNYPEPLSVRNLHNDVTDKSVQALLNSVKKNIGLFHEYFRLKGKMHNMTLDRYDIYMPEKENKKKYPYDESKEIVLNTLKEFDPSMQEQATKIFDKNHIHSDVVPNKRSGAFAYYINPETTPYLLLNHVNKLDDVYTMAHEVGHGVHFMLASEHNPYFLAHSNLPLAETASIFSEMLLSQKLMKDADPETKRQILIRMLDGQYGSIPRQAYFVLFEIAAHKAISDDAANATVERLNNLYMDNLKEQFGDSLKVPDIFQHEWKYIPHIFYTPFYCYAYAFGNLLVLALYKMYLEQGDSFKPKIIKILKYGGSISPQEILGEIGIDMESEDFWQKGFDVIKDEIVELKSLLG